MIVLYIHGVSMHVFLVFVLLLITKPNNLDGNDNGMWQWANFNELNTPQVN